MIDIEGLTLGEVVAEAAARWPDAPALRAPASSVGGARSYTFAEAEREANRIAGALAPHVGRGKRVAVLLGTRPEFYLVKFALARLGASMVPVNPDYRPGELAYLLEDSGAALALTDEARAQQMRAGVAASTAEPKVMLLEALEPGEAPWREVDPRDEASLLYTSGTTGRPKGCVLSHRYELQCGARYGGLGGLVGFAQAGEVVFNPLPSFHVNAGVLTLWGLMLTGNCLAQPERFSATTWWRDIAETKATMFHYLGVVISVLMADRETGPEAASKVRLGFGAGVEPALHAAFEDRFGLPLVECWGMTEMCRVMTMEEEPRRIDTRAFGRARGDLEVRVVDRDDRDVPVGEPGEMIMRHSAETPREGFFSGYLNKPDATEEAWRGGWFHTGDTVRMDAEGVIHFIDRAKNIIRRSGENIAAAEVENTLFADERVVQVACLAVADEIREEEVMACIVLAPGVEADEATARSLFGRAMRELAYYKPPGWILFVEDLPVTGTQKVLKHQIFGKDEDPRRRPGVVDLRALKKRGA